MALSGTIWGGMSHYQLKLEWSATQSKAKNESYVTVRMSLVIDSGYTLSVNNRPDTTITTAGNITRGTAPSINGTGAKLLLTSNTVTVKHNANGTGSFSVAGYYPIAATINGTYYSSLTVSGNGTLDTIDVTPGTPGTPVGGGLGRGGYIYHNEAPGLTWAGASGTVTGYEVQMRYMARSGGSWSGWSTIGSPSGTSLTSYRWMKADAVAGGKVEFRVRAKNGSLAGAWSGSLSLKIDGGGWIQVAAGWKYGTIWVKDADGWKRNRRTWVKTPANGWVKGK